MPSETNTRASTKTISQKRSHRDCTILVTGGTGFIGSHVAIELLRRGFSVTILARPRGPLSAERRVSALLDWFDLDSSGRSRLTVLEGHLDAPDLGLSKPQYANLVDVTDEIVHCASNTSFSERKREEVEKANVSNLENILGLAAKSHVYFFHHVSTAYVAGKTSGRCAEVLVKPQEFTNVYEETKCRAEAVVAAECAHEGIRFNIYRPSIVYGSSKTGRTLLFNGLYYPVRTVAFLKDLFERDMNERQGKKAGEVGVRRDGEGKLYLPLRIEAATSGGVNLVPIDYFLEAFMGIMEESLEGGIFHITNTKSTTMEELADFTRRFFRVEGISAVPGEVFGKEPRNALEILFDQYIQAYGPYMRDTRVFENSNTRAVLAKRNLSCPEFNYDIFSKCMKYAENVGWGMKPLEGTRRNG